MTLRNPNNTWTTDTLARGDIDAIRAKAREDSTYVHSRDFVGDTPLQTAIAFGHLELVKFLLEHGADPNVKVDDGYTCLLTAIESESNESTAIVAELIRAGADIHGIGINGWTPLHMAAANGHVEKAALLINAGADVDRRTQIDGTETPLMEAAFRGQPSTVRLLLAHGADPTLRETGCNRTPKQIAENAAQGPQPDIVTFLRNDDSQVDVDALYNDLELDLPADQLEIMKQMIKNMDRAQSYIDNSTELANSGNHAEVVRILDEYQR